MANLLKRFSLANQIMIWFLLLIAICLTLLTWFDQRLFRRELEQEAAARMESVVALKADSIDRYINERLIQVTQLAHSPAIIDAMNAYADVFYAQGPGSAAYAALEAPLIEYKEQYLDLGGYHDLFLISPDAQIVYTFQKEADWGISLRSDAYRDTDFAQLVEAVLDSRRPSISPFAFYAPSAKPAAFTAAPIYDGATLIGVLALQIENQALYDVVEARSGLGETGETVVAANVDGVVLFVAPTYFDPQAAFTRRVSFGAEEALPIQDALQQNSGVGISLDYRSEEVMAAWTYIPSIEWGLVVKTDTAELFAPLRTMRVWTIAASGLAFLLVTVIAHLMGRSFSRPLTHLTTTAHALAHGDLTQRPSVIGSDELSQLAAAFNAVIDNLEAAVHQAEQIAQGDFTVTITPRGEQDVLGIALQQMTATLQKTADVAVTLVQGDLPDRLIEKGERDLLTHALNGMIDKLRELAAQAEQIAAGEYEMLAAPRGSHDQLGLALQKMVWELRAVTAENAERLWRAHGRAQLSEQLHGDLDLQQMAQRAIHFLCRYLELPIGALYVREADDSFRLTASFAFQRRKGLPKTFKPGVGLVGQAAQTAETLLVEQLPDDYFSLQSAWVAGPPQSVLLQPCRAAGVVECVLELGNFTEWTPAQQTFLGEVSELIAVSLNVAKGLAERERMREALQAHKRLIKEQKTEIARQKVLLHEKNEQLTQQAQKLLASEAALRQRARIEKGVGNEN